MSISEPKKRISYTLPSPNPSTVRRLTLPPEHAPRLGQSAPLLIPVSPLSSPRQTLTAPPLGPRPKGSPPPVHSPHKAHGHGHGHARGSSISQGQHPRHRLGITSLALDTSTFLEGYDAPTGILYSSGRDGLVASWDLGLRMRESSDRKRGNRRRDANATITDQNSLASFNSVLSADEDDDEDGDDVESRARKRRRGNKWEAITGWGQDDDSDGEDDLVSFGLDGDVLGDVTRRGRKGSQILPGAPSLNRKERKWEIDKRSNASLPATRFRQSVQAHTDWINDMKLCNANQTVASASSDGLIKAWSPHSRHPTEPSVIGAHADYVRCLAVCPTQNWIASGSFDRTIKLWDISRTWPSSSSSPVSASSSAPVTPLATLSQQSTNMKQSVYALAVDSRGGVVASGGPDRIVRLWDPRAGIQGRGGRTGKLVGHTDNIRAILLSEDGRYILTGSADASIKLWSLAGTTQKCLQTFTHHTDSIWAMYSSHPNLEVFYSGDRSGVVCRVDVSGRCNDVGDGECVVLCRDTGDDEYDKESSSGAAGISSMVASSDDTVLWTSSGSHSNIKRWRIPERRAVRRAARMRVSRDRAESGGTLDGSLVHTPHSPGFGSVHSQQQQYKRQSQTPSLSSRRTSNDNGEDRDGERDHDESGVLGVRYAHLVRMPTAHDPFPYAGPPGGAVGSYSMVSIASVHAYAYAAPRVMSPVPVPVVQQQQQQQTASERAMYEAREEVSSAVPFSDGHGPEEVVRGEQGLVRALLLNDRVHALCVDSRGEVGVWDVLRGVCLGVYGRGEVRRAVCGDVDGAFERQGQGDRDLVMVKSPREALEAVRERIEGEAVVSGWCGVDTKMGVLTVHLGERCFEAEVYADEVGLKGERGFVDDAKLNLGKWVLKNLFAGFIREEQKLQAQRMHTALTPRNEAVSSHFSAAPPTLRRGTSPGNLEFDSHIRGASSKRRSSDSSSTSSSQSRSRGGGSASLFMTVSPTMIPAVPVPPPTTFAPGSSRASPLITPMIPLHTGGNNNNNAHMPSIPQSPSGAAHAADATPLAVGGTSTLRRLRSGTLDSTSGAPLPSSSALATTTPKEGNSGSDYFSVRTRSGSNAPSTTPGAADESGLVVSGGKGLVTPGGAEVMAQTPATPGGFKGLLKSFGKSSKSTGKAGDASATSTQTAVSAEMSTVVEEPLTPGPKINAPLQKLLSATFSPPSAIEAPNLGLSSSVILTISEESDAGFTSLYRGSISSTNNDTSILERTMPMWLLECLLHNKTAVPPHVKISFVLMPYVEKDGEGEQLPELLNTNQSKLTASRLLRVRKLTLHVQDKLERLASSSPVADRTSIDSSSFSTPLSPRFPRHRAEDLYEILCNNQVLPLDMTLAQIRQYVWKQSSELVMHYRKKVHRA